MEAFSIDKPEANSVTKTKDFVHVLAFISLNLVGRIFPVYGHMLKEAVEDVYVLKTTKVKKGTISFVDDEKKAGD